MLIFAHIQSAWNYQKRFIVNGERQRFLNQSMIVLLNIGGKSCSHGRAFTIKLRQTPFSVSGNKISLPVTINQIYYTSAAGSNGCS
jgi:hypothetical protein